MTPQIIGNKKSAPFRGCIRFCRERNIPFQERNNREKPLSPGELDSIATAVGGFSALIDTDSRAYRDRGLQWMDYDPRDELISNPDLLKLPIVRSDRGAAVDPDRSTLEELLTEGK